MLKAMMQSGMMDAGMTQGGMMQNGMMGDGMMGVGWIFPILILVALVLLVVWLVRQIRGGGDEASPPSDAREIARRRYARGEISREELHTILGELSR